jgi:heme-degrading monooxygenase HmoA
MPEIRSLEVKAQELFTLQKQLNRGPFLADVDSTHSVQTAGNMFRSRKTNGIQESATKWNIDRWFESCHAHLRWIPRSRARFPWAALWHSADFSSPTDSDLEKEVKTAFRDRSNLVEEASGYLRMDEISPVDAPAESWLLTFWIDESRIQTWRRGHHDNHSHRGIPKGLKLVSRETRVTHFQHVSS